MSRDVNGNVGIIVAFKRHDLGMNSDKTSNDTDVNKAHDGMMFVTVLSSTFFVVFTFPLSS